MNKILVLILLVVAISCNGNKNEEVTTPTTPAADTLMDSTTIKMKADTTVKRLDNLEDSINRLRDKAAEQN